MKKVLGTMAIFFIFIRLGAGFNGGIVLLSGLIVACSVIIHEDIKELKAAIENINHTNDEKQ